MDQSVQRLLQDRLYDKRKAGALELESIIRASLAEHNHDRIGKIVHQLCHDYAYAVHQPHARNGGLIGLAAVAIALGPDVSRYLREIVPPVLACFSDQDARVRYYACESMYNIAKVAKGDILIYFNSVFDALSKLAADTELSVKNGAELLDRLVKDIVSESAATYVVREQVTGSDGTSSESSEKNPGFKFNLEDFIPLLEERINVLNPFARTFLVGWITLLDGIPDLELVVYLPRFLGGLLRFLTDSNTDVHTHTKTALGRFLTEIKKIAEVKKTIAERQRLQGLPDRKLSQSSYAASGSVRSDLQEIEGSRESRQNGEMQSPEVEVDHPGNDSREADNSSSITGEYEEDQGEGEFSDEWIYGQDVQIEYQQILEIFVSSLSSSSNEEIQVMALRWIEAFLEICPEDILVFTPRLLSQLLPALAHEKERVSGAAQRVNSLLTQYVVSLPEEQAKQTENPSEQPQASSNSALKPPRDASAYEKRDSIGLIKGIRKSNGPDPKSMNPTPEVSLPESVVAEPEPTEADHHDLNYEAAVNALTLQFLHTHEATRVAALAWLIMLHRKSPREIVAIKDNTFPALLKTLSDPADAVVTRDLLLLSQISKGNDDSFFTSFMVNLLKLFCTDRRLLQTRGNLIIRQLCLSLSAERIYRTMADCLEREEDDIEFASIMVQILNNNLLTAPELADMRKRLRNLDSRDGQTLFTVLFKAWCVNSVATFSLCLLAQAYEQAYNLIQNFCDIEMTVNILIQIDKLVQLLESPVFTYLRMQLLEPERYPYLYKCLYGVLMLLPQSSAFAALKNRLNSVGAIGYLQIGGRGASATPGPAVSTFERQNRLKRGDEGGIKWTDLLEKFRNSQDKARQLQRRQLLSQHGLEEQAAPQKENRAVTIVTASDRTGGPRPESAQSGPRPQIQLPQPSSGHTKGKSSLSNLGRFAGGVRAGKSKK